MNVMDLCTGIGGFSLAGKWLIGDWRTVCYVEIDKYCQQVIQQRIRDGYLDDAPIWDDLKTFDGRPWRGSVDIITAGFPCQPFSIAGKRQGEKDDRNLWPDVWRVCSEVRPRIIFLENVPAILAHKVSGQILSDLACGGYNALWCCLPAYIVGAPQVGRRWYLLATSDSERLEGLYKKSGGINLQSVKKDVPQNVWKTYPDVYRRGNGVPRRVDRLKSLGNAVVPAVVAKAWEILK